MTHGRTLLVALSAGGLNKELAAHGVGLDHINELMVQIARKLLMQRCLLAFGGTLGVKAQPLTESLIDAALSWLDEGSAKIVDVTQPATWPLVNHSAWPFSKNISEERRAELVGVCRFIDVDPPGVAAADLDAAYEDWPTKPRAKLYIADALSEMRRQSAEAADLRIVWGGRIVGALGWMAGILEEVAFSLKYEKPILILGGFGGCASLIADFLRGPDSPWPEQLSLAASADPGRDDLLSPDDQAALEKRLEQVKQRLTDFRTRIHNERSVFGVSSAHYLSGLDADSQRIALGLVSDVADQRRSALS